MQNQGPTAALGRVNYDVWCECARQLLGWAEGDSAEWPAFYRAGLTPLQGARETGFGDLAAEFAVWV